LQDGTCVVKNIRTGEQERLSLANVIYYSFI
jgi:hypothetical protein